jgi:hypothetical protein
MNDPHLTVSPAPGITPEEARDARARALACVFQCHAKKKAAGEDGGEEHARKESNDVSRNRTVPQP